jgi:hypothetical protein
VNLTAYAALDDQGRLAVTLINKDQNADADIAISSDRSLQHATALRLRGRALDSASDVTLGGSAVAADGRWKPADVETVKAAGGVCNIHVPAASAAVVTWSA